MDQFMIRNHVRIILCFPLDLLVDDHDVVAVLEDGLAKTLNQLPFLSGVVQSKQDSKRNEIEIVYNDHDPISFVVNHVEDKLPPYDYLTRQKIPMSYLKDELVSPFGHVPDATKDLSVLAVQANFIHGGLLLCLCLHHSVMDGTAFGTLINIFANNCAGALESDADVAIADLDRSPLFRGLPEDVTVNVKDFPDYALSDPKLSTQRDMTDPGIPPMTSRIFYFTKSNLAALKAAASPADPDEWVSTNDAMCALIWSCITRARSPRLDHDVQSHLCVPVNCRPRIKPPMPPTYLGNLSIDSISRASVGCLLSDPLSIFSSRVRSSVKNVDSNYIRRVIALIKTCPGDINHLKAAFHAVLGKDIIITSWADFPVYEADFGPLLGKPEWMRCPYRALDGTVKILARRQGPRPGSEEAGLEVNIELREDDMYRLLNDPLLNEYACAGEIVG